MKNFCYSNIIVDILFNKIQALPFLGYYNFVFRVPKGARDFRVIQRSGSRKPDTVALGMPYSLIVVAIAVDAFVVVVVPTVVVATVVFAVIVARYCCCSCRWCCCSSAPFHLFLPSLFILT